MTRRPDPDRATAFLLAVNDLCEEHGYSIRRGITLNEWRAECP